MRPNERGKRADQQGPLKETLSSETADSVLLENHSAVLRRVLDHLSTASGIECPSDETRHELATALCAIAPDAVTIAEDALIAYMQGSASELSIRAMTALQRIISPSTPMFHALSAAICHENRAIRVEAFQAARYVGESAPPLVLALMDTLDRQFGRNEFEAESAAKALGEIGPAAAHAVPVLIAALDFRWNYGTPYEDEFYDNSSYAQERRHQKWIAAIEDVIRKIGAVAIPIQAWAIRKGLGGDNLITLASVIGASAAVPLEIALSDVDSRVRLAAAQALAKIPATAALGAFPTLTAALCNPEESEGVRIAAAEALRFIANAEAGPTALGAISALGTVLCNPAEGEHVRQAAAESLKWIAPTEGEAMVSALSAALDDENMLVRLYAAQGLVRVGRRVPPILSAVPELLKVVSGVVPVHYFEGEAQTVRCDAIEVLAAMGPSAAPLTVPALMRELDGESPIIVNAAVRALKQFGASSSSEIATLSERLQGSDTRNRRETADVLSGIPGGTAILMEALEDQQVEVRKCAAKALQRIDPNDKDMAIPALIKALGDEDDDVRNAVVAVLADRDSESFPALIQLLRKGEASLRPTIAWGLSRMLETIPPDRLHDKPIALLRKAWHDRAADVRHCAIVLLFQKDGVCEQPLKILREALRDTDPRIRRFAVTTLARRGPSAIPDLITALLDNDDGVRLDAVTGLAAFGSEATGATTPLARMLGDRSPTIRKSAGDAIARIGPLESEFGQRMQSEVIQSHKKLHVFRLIGEILLEQGVDTMPFGKLATTLEDRYQQELSQNTLRNYRDDVNDLFRVYRGEPEPQYEDREHRLTTVNEEADFFDRRQGRPFRMLKKGWESWGETKLYFAVIEGALQDLT